MNFRKHILSFVMALPLFTALAETGSYSKAEAELKDKNQIALQNLANVREKIKNEKIPLATKLSSLERNVAEKRRELDRLQRLRDNKSVSLVALKKEVDGRKNEAQFLATLGSDYLANFEARLHVSEIESNQEKLNSIKSVLDGTSADKSKMIARMDLLKLSLARIENLLGGMRFEGKALDSTGKVVDGSFILSGPLSYFSSTEGSLSGLTQSGRDLKPRIFSLPSEQSTQIRNTFSSDRNSTTVLPIDATQGDALKVAAAEDTVVEHVKKGGTWAYPIVFAASVSLLIALFKYFQLNGISIPRQKAVSAIIEKVEQGDQKGAEKLAGSLKGPFKSMFTAGITRMGEGKKMVDEVMYEELLASQPKLESYLSVIQVTAATAPLMGLLGTVTGMIKTFKQITLFGTGDAKSLSEGISEALITTELGLVAAIPSLILYAILSKKSKAILAEMERLSCYLVKEWFLEEVWSLWLQGGSLMIMLLVISLILYFATLETYVFLRSKTAFKKSSKSTLISWIQSPESADHETAKMLAYVAEGKETLGEARRRFDEIRACFLPQIDRRITFLSLLVSTAPLAGLLGTVMGMLTTFKGLSTSSGGKTIDFVAGGISEALITTQTGLIIAIPAYILINRIVSHRDQLEICFTTLESLTMQSYKGLLESEEEE